MSKHCLTNKNKVQNIFSTQSESSDLLKFTSFTKSLHTTSATEPSLHLLRKHGFESADGEQPVSKHRRIDEISQCETSMVGSAIDLSTCHSTSQRQSSVQSSESSEDELQSEEKTTKPFRRSKGSASDQIEDTFTNSNQCFSKITSASPSPGADIRSEASRGIYARPLFEAPPKTAAERQINQVVLNRLSKIPGPPVKVVNDVDESSLPLGFNFIDKCIVREGVTKADKGFMSGCNCRPENGRHVGCEYTSCECLEFAQARQNGNKAFPYYCTGPKTGCLRQTYLNSRDAIFECNEFCNCGTECKNRNVQKGRQIPLEIFKTPRRGWGLRCPEPLRAGQFVDIYKGEVITSEEADRREARVEKVKDSYLYTLDKFGKENGLKDEEAYIIDGEYFGGPTRFINHSCEPNCRQFTVLYNHGDMRVYDLAFFTICEMPAFTELTFDYLDKEVDDEDEKKKVKASDRKGGKGDVKPTKCLCGAKKCRKWLWM